MAHANNTITFDPDAGVSYGVNLTVNSGANFKSTFKVLKTDKSAFSFSGYDGAAQMAKSVAVGSTGYAVATFGVGFSTTVTGEFNISLTPAVTRTLNPGRYVYNILVSSGTTTYNIVDGNILVQGGISSAP